MKMTMATQNLMLTMIIKVKRLFSCCYFFGDAE